MQTSGIKIDLENSDKLFVEYGKEIEKVLRFAVRQAVLEHKRAGNPVAIWKGGKAVLIAPDEIEVEKFKQKNDFHKRKIKCQQFWKQFDRLKIIW